MLKEIRLYGHLGQKFGRVHKLAVQNIGEAMRALQANFSNFEKEVVEYIPGYRVWIGTEKVKNTNLEVLNMPFSEKEIIRISPAVMGSGGDDGIFSIILGVALIVATGPMGMGAWGMAAGTGAAAGSFAAISGGFLLNVGISLVMGGVSSLLSPKVDSDNTSNMAESPENRTSDIFSGPINTSAQGHPVPVGYGRLIIGSAVISAGLTTTNL